MEGGNKMSVLLNFATTRENGSLHVEARLYSPDDPVFVRKSIESLFVDPRLESGDLQNPTRLASRCAQWHQEMEFGLKSNKKVQAVYWIACNGGKPEVYELRK
jgi:hypothetical protein